jgi:hypothetical protein
VSYYLFLKIQCAGIHFDFDFDIDSDPKLLSKSVDNSEAFTITPLIIN